AAAARLHSTDCTWGRACRRLRIGRRVVHRRADRGGSHIPGLRPRKTGNSLQLVLLLCVWFDAFFLEVGQRISALVGPPRARVGTIRISVPISDVPATMLAPSPLCFRRFTRHRFYYFGSLSCSARARSFAMRSASLLPIA